MSLAPKQHSKAFEALVEDAKSRVRHISLDEYKTLAAKGEAGVLVDVREESEWAAGHAAGAVHLGKGVIERDIEAKVPDTAAPLVLYCGGGFRSALAADNLARMGYTNVLSMDGGYRVWREKGYPLNRE